MLQDYQECQFPFNHSLQENKVIYNSPLKILVVEDNFINQAVAKTMLKTMGYEVTIAATGQEALVCFQQNQYALVLMDLGLPDQCGIEVTRAIIQWEKAQGSTHTPIIAHTANGRESKSECLAAGMDDFASKPIEFEALEQLIKAWIEKTNNH